MGFFGNLFNKTESVTKQPIHITDANFRAEVLESTMPVFVNFWGQGCGPCVKFEDVVFALATEFDGKVKICAAASAENRSAARKFNVRSTPTVLYFKDGALFERVIGFKGAHYHRQLIENEIFGDARGS